MIANILGAVLPIKYLEEQNISLDVCLFLYLHHCYFQHYGLLTKKIRLFTIIVECHVLKPWITFIYRMIDDTVPPSALIPEISPRWTATGFFPLKKIFSVRNWVDE